MARWYFGLDPSAIQEGTYPDLHRGQQLDFAVVVELDSWKPAPPDHVEAVRIEGCRYDVVARVEAVGPTAWVLDCGVLMGGDGPTPAAIEVGRWVRGRARLVVCSRPGLLRGDDLPDLTRSWFVERIHHRTPDPGAGDLGDLGLGLFGGPEEPGWEELAFTDAWRDDDGHADYLLECLAVDE